MRPSDLYGIEDPLAAYCFDKAVFIFGSNLEADVKKATEKAKTQKAATSKAQQVLVRWLHEPEDSASQFRDPAAGRK